MRRWLMQLLQWFQVSDGSYAYEARFEEEASR